MTTELGNSQTALTELQMGIYIGSSQLINLDGNLCCVNWAISSSQLLESYALILRHHSGSLVLVWSRD